jgi:hypothetical protein
MYSTSIFISYLTFTLYVFSSEISQLTEHRVKIIVLYLLKGKDWPPRMVETLISAASRPLPDEVYCSNFIILPAAPNHTGPYYS